MHLYMHVWKYILKYVCVFLFCLLCWVRINMVEGWNRNLWPLTGLNADLNILVKVLAQQLQVRLNHLISPEQTSAVKGKMIQDLYLVGTITEKVYGFAQPQRNSRVLSDLSSCSKVSCMNCKRVESSFCFFGDIFIT